jgi:hypothetical protein
MFAGTSQQHYFIISAVKSDEKPKEESFLVNQLRMNPPWKG